jgi:hypothetical protein
MARKQPSKRKRAKTSLPVLGAAGVSLAVAGGASATAPTANVPAQDNGSRPVVTLGEEEISDVNLATVLRLQQGRRPDISSRRPNRSVGMQGL